MEMLEDTRIDNLNIKNILVVGNGFDLYHNLPTNYKDFMDVINRLIKIKTDGVMEARWLTFLFGKDSPLYVENGNIKKCFDTYYYKIANTELNTRNINSMISIAKENIWFKYFNVCINGNIGWIDFEKEIRYVVESFELFFYQVKNKYIIGEVGEEQIISIDFRKLSRDVIQVLNSFDFFQEMSFMSQPTFIKIKKNYVIERNTSDGIMLMGIDEKKIMDELADELDSFSNLFELYIKEIINKISLDKTKYNPRIFDNFDGVISFNYTDTYKNIYNESISNEHIEFIHGKAGNGNIVFGINSDIHDELEDFNENYIKFKKEYRRLRSGNFLNYRKLFNHENRRINFMFFGHSLDKTDEDILKELIEYKNARCIIYYLDNQAKNAYIINLYKFFGREKIKELFGDDKIEFRLISDYEINEAEAAL